MTELTFLLELLLNHKLPQATKRIVTERVREVEAKYNAPQVAYQAPIASPSTFVGLPMSIPPHLVGQSPSTIAAMMRNGFVPEAPTIGMAPVGPAVAPTQPAVIAQTPAAAAALADRQNAIAQAISGKPEKGRTSPRKF